MQTYLKERIREVLTGSSDAIVVRIYGRDLDELRDEGRRGRGRARRRSTGIIDLHVELQAEIPQIEVEVDLAAAERYGLKPGDVRRAAATLMSGEEVGDIFRDGKAYDVQVWSTPETRNSVTSVQRAADRHAGGGNVRLDDVADVRIAPTPNASAARAVPAASTSARTCRAATSGAVVDDVEAALGRGRLPARVSPGAARRVPGAPGRPDGCSCSALAAAIGIFLLLQASFGSTAPGDARVPDPAVGAGRRRPGGLPDGGVISLGSLVGFLTVLGIAARNGIMLINHFQHLERYEGETFGPELVLRGARERLSPILMTALATGLALVPLVVAGDIPGHEIEHPMAVVILGGLVTSTLLNLFVVPSLYLRFAKPRESAPLDPAAA